MNNHKENMFDLFERKVLEKYMSQKCPLKIFPLCFVYS